MSTQYAVHSRQHAVAHAVPKMGSARSSDSEIRPSNSKNAMQHANSGHFWNNRSGDPLRNGFRRHGRSRGQHRATRPQAYRDTCAGIVPILSQYGPNSVPLCTNMFQNRSLFWIKPRQTRGKPESGHEISCGTCFLSRNHEGRAGEGRGGRGMAGPHTSDGTDLLQMELEFSGAGVSITPNR